MDVILDRIVHLRIIDFYESALNKYPSLDEYTISKKLVRIYDALEELGKYATMYGKARLKSEWLEKGYQECIIEDFHFAYRIYKDEFDQDYVYVHDACHSFLYYSDSL